MGASKLGEGVQAWWELTADCATCGQALWNQQPVVPCVGQAWWNQQLILPGVEKHGGINRRSCQVWTSLAASHRLAWQNQQLLLPGVEDEPGEGTPWQNQQPILLGASESLVRRLMVESTADSARCG